MRIDLHLGLLQGDFSFSFFNLSFFSYSKVQAKAYSIISLQGFFFFFLYCLQRILHLFKGLNLTSQLHRDQFFSLTLNRAQICLLQNLHCRPAMDWQLPLRYLPASEFVHLSGILLSFYFCPLRIFFLYSAQHIRNLKQFYASFSSVLK